MDTPSPGDRNAETRLLTETDLPPVNIINPQAVSPFLLVGDHAGALIPAMLGNLGLSDADLRRHIALDIGVQALGEALSAQLDATFIAQRYSRLVVDCNRAPLSAETMPAVSDGTPIPGNAALSPLERKRRIAAIHEPYQNAIAQHLRGRDAMGIESILVSLHSFTPVMGGIARPWHIGVLYEGGDASFATALLERLRHEHGIVVGDNEPYRMDVTDHTVPHHAFPMRRPYVELEFRQDLIGDGGGVALWSERLARILSWSLRVAKRAP